MAAELVVPNAAEDTTQAIAFQEMLLPAGIQITLKVEPLEVYLEHWMDVPFGAVGWMHRPVPGVFLNLAYKCTSNWNESNWCDPEFDKLVEQLDAEIDVAKRNEIAKQIQIKMSDEGSIVLSWFKPSIRAVRQYVKGHSAHPSDFFDVRETWLDT